MKIEVLLISKLDSNLNLIKQMIQDDEIVITGESSGGASALDKIDNISPNIIIMTLGAGDPDVLNLAERIILHKPRCYVILLTENLDTDALFQATKVGVHNITAFPTSPKDFANYIKFVYHNETTRINSLGEQQNIAWMSKVITVFGSKGGLGKTTIATNLAVKLAEQRKKVALIDLDLQFGDAHVFLDVEPKDTISELVFDEHTPDIDSVRSYMVIHSSGVHLLCAPRSPEYAEYVSAERVQGLLSLLRSYYDYVIIDTPPYFNDVTLTAIECSSVILFVTGLDISILKNSKRSLALLESLQQKDKVKVLVNRVTKASSISTSDVQKITGCPIWAVIPSDYIVAVTALNRGIPVVIGSPKTKLSQSFSEIANLLINGDYHFDLQNANKKERKKLKDAQSQKLLFWKKK